MFVFSLIKQIIILHVNYELLSIIEKINQNPQVTKEDNEKSVISVRNKIQFSTN